MSWSINLIGKTDNIMNALEEQSKKLEGDSKVEFDAALPHIVGLLKENFNNVGNPVMQLAAAGHGHDAYRQCTVSLSFLPATLV